MRTPRSLSFVVSLFAAVAMAAGMALFAAYQYAVDPGLTLSSLFFVHLRHVLALGLPIYIACWIVLRRVLVEPIRKINLHLYGIGAGQVQPIDMVSGIREIQAIVSGVNMMVRRMELGFDGDRVDQIETRIRKIRSVALGAAGSADPEWISRILEAIRELELETRRDDQRHEGSRGAVGAPRLVTVRS